MVRAEQVTERCTMHGEGAFWAGDRLLLVDMLAGAVVELVPGGGPVRHELGGIAAVIRRRASGGFVLAVERGFRLLDEHLDPVGEPIPVFDDPAIRMNEGGVDPQGRFHVGTMAYDTTPGAGTIYRLDPDRSVRPVLTGVTISNGLHWLADGRSVYYVDTPTGRVDRMDFDASSGTFGERRPFATPPEGAGSPDGCAIDVEDGVWVALWGGSAVHRYDASGRLSQVVELPVRDITSCAFGGPDGTTLFITTSRDGWGDEHAEPVAGAVFAVEAGVRGAALPAWAG